MNLHEVYSDLMGEMSKLDWKRDALLHKAIGVLKYWQVLAMPKRTVPCGTTAIAATCGHCQRRDSGPLSNPPYKFLYMNWNLAVYFP